VFDGSREHLARLIQVGRGQVRAEVIESRHTRKLQVPIITLAFGAVRPDPFQQILRHGTELGVSCFVPILTQRTTPRGRERKDRWDAVVASASAPSGRTVLPVIEPPTPLDEFIGRDFGSGVKFILSAGSRVEPLLAALEVENSTGVVLLVGPEGGFDLSEEEQAIKAGFRRAGLGSHILRTETAAIVAVGVIASWYHRFEFKTGSDVDDRENAGG